MLTQLEIRIIVITVVDCCLLYLLKLLGKEQTCVFGLAEFGIFLMAGVEPGKSARGGAAGVMGRRLPNFVESDIYSTHSKHFSYPHENIVFFKFYSTFSCCIQVYYNNCNNLFVVYLLGYKMLFSYIHTIAILRGFKRVQTL